MTTEETPYEAIDEAERRVDCPYGCENHQDLHPRDVYCHLLLKHLDELPDGWRAVIEENSPVTAFKPHRTGPNGDPFEGEDDVAWRMPVNWLSIRDRLGELLEDAAPESRDSLLRTLDDELKGASDLVLWEDLK